MPSLSAIERAATLLRDPLRVARMRSEPLPSDVTTLLRIIARDPDVEMQAAETLGKPRALVREAAEFYVTQILLHPTSDPYRMLGARADAPREELRTNLALLMRWLHPDIAGPQHRGLTERVLKAWNDLKAPDTRIALDENLAKSRENRRRRRRELARRVDQRTNAQRPRTDEKAKPRNSGRPRKLRFALVGAGLVAAGGVAYASDVFAGVSQLVMSWFEPAVSSQQSTESEPDNTVTDGTKNATKRYLAP